MKHERGKEAMKEGGGPAGTIRRVYAVWYRNATVYRTYALSSLVSNIGEPLFYLFAMGIGIGSFIPEIGGMPYLDFIAPGLIVTGVMYSAVFECTFGSFTRMTTQRTFESILATPVGPADLVAGELAWGTTKGLISAAAVLTVMTAFGIYHPGPWLFGIVVVAALTGLTFSAAALGFSALAPDYQFFNYFFTLGIAPMFFLSGVFFPLDQFPEQLQWFSLALPATHAVVAARDFFHGTVEGGRVFNLLFLAGVSSLLSVTAYLLVRRRMER